MQTEDAPDGSLVLHYDSRGLSRFLMMVAAAMLAGAVYMVVTNARNSERLVGLAAGSLTVAGIAFVFFERARVVVNPAERSIEWAHRWAVQARAGRLAFGDVEAVLLERPIGDHGVPSHRIVLRTKDGRTIPLTVGYRPDGDRAIQTASDRLRSMLGLDTSPEATLEALVASGRTIDAMRLLRERDGMSLAEAKRRVDVIRKAV